MFNMHVDIIKVFGGLDIKLFTLGFILKKILSYSFHLMPFVINTSHVFGFVHVTNCRPGFSFVLL